MKFSDYLRNGCKAQKDEKTYWLNAVGELFYSDPSEGIYSAMCIDAEIIARLEDEYLEATVVTDPETGKQELVLNPLNYFVLA